MISFSQVELVRCLFFAFIAAFPLAVFNHYVFCDNETNHTGDSPYILFIFFVPVALASLLKIKPYGNKWLIPLAIAMVGALNVIIFDTLHVMESYSSWIHSGMPERPAWSLILGCYKHGN
jgi:hypothetical protein